MLTTLGSQRGQQYAQLFPHNIRSMVLDGVVDHTVPLGLVGISSNVGFGRAMDDFYQWASTNSSSALHGSDAKTVFQTLLDQVEKSPVHLEECAQSGKCSPSITKSSIMSTIAGQMENELNHPIIAKTIAQAVIGNFTAWQAPIDTQRTGVSYSYKLGCLDSYTNETYAQWSNRQRAQAALVGYDYSGVTMPDARFLQCPKWPAKVVNSPKPLDIANTSAPILLVSSTLDPAAPYDGAVNVQRQIAGSVLLTRRGAGHGSMYAVRDGQAQDIMIEYFLTGKMPAPDTVVDS
jgi:pimeloyl-ACP methyl ester carboxylesterase